MSKQEMNWAAIDTDPRFQELHRKKTSFLWGLLYVRQNSCIHAEAASAH